MPSSAVIGRSRDTLQKAATGRNFSISDKEWLRGCYWGRKCIALMPKGPPEDMRVFLRDRAESSVGQPVTRHSTNAFMRVFVSQPV